MVSSSQELRTRNHGSSEGTPLQMLAFSSSIFPLVQFSSLAGFADWHPSTLETWARWLLPRIPESGTDLGVPEFRELYGVAGKWTMLDAFRAGMIVRRLDQCLDAEGDVFECGTGPGGL